MIGRKALLSATLLLAASFSWQASAATVELKFAGAGISADLVLEYGAATDAKYPQAFEITGISGTFSDATLGIVNAPIGSLVAINHATPEAANLLAPNDFSRFAVANGLAPISNGFLTYDNLYYPGGSPQTASDYPLHGGVFDIYGLMFNIGAGRVVDLWSAGTPSGVGPFDYGVAVATSAEALHYLQGGVAAVPEPGTIGLLSSGLVGMLLLGRRRFSRRAAA